MFGSDEELVELTERLGKLAAVDPELLTDADRYALAAFGAQAKSLGSLIEAIGVSGLDEAGTVDLEHGQSAARWHAAETGTSPASAKTAVKVGSALRRRFARLRDAVAVGELSFEQARCVVDASNPRIADGMAAVQDWLISLTGEVSGFRAWSQQVRGFAQELDQDGGYDPHRDPARTTARISRLPNNLTHLDATFTDEHAGIEHLVNARADELYHQAVRDHDHTGLAVPGRSQLLAQALADLVRRGATTPAGQAPAAEVILIIRAEDPSVISTLDGERISPETAALLACDAVFHPIIVDSQGVPLWLGRGTRLATAGQRRALFARDGACTFPGCDAPASWCDAHHVWHWEHGGPTDLPNLTLLCRRHHGVIHRTGWRMQPHPHHPGHYRITTPTGKTLTTQHRREPQRRC